MIYSSSNPKNPHTLPDPGMIMASMHPLRISMIRSVTHPRHLQSHILITSLFRSSQNLIAATCRFICYFYYIRSVRKRCHSTAYAAITFSLSNAFTIIPVSTAPSTSVIPSVTPYCIMVTSCDRIPFSTSEVL